MTSVLDGYLVDPKVSLLDKARIQAQVLVPVLRALRAELGKDKADAVVKQALRDWSKQLFAAIGDGIEGSPRRKWATIQKPWGEVSGKEVEVEILRHDKEALDIDVTRCRFAEFLESNATLTFIGHAGTARGFRTITTPALLPRAPRRPRPSLSR